MTRRLQPFATFPSVPVPIELPKAADTDAAMVQRVFRLTPAQAHELKKFCAAENTSMQSVILAGINMVLQSKGLPPL